MKNILILLLFLLFIFIPLSAMADPFSDIPQGHWSYDAVNMLEEKGLLEGYPDGLFKGDRPMSRYEMAMVVARVIGKLEQIEASIPQMPDLSIYATKEDLEVINLLAKEFKSELDALGIRVTNIEDSLGKLSERVDELERVFIRGDMTAVGSSVGFTKGYWENPDLPILCEDYGGYALSPGFAFTSRLNLDIGINISENFTAGGTLVGYSAFGDAPVAYTWGVIPPYNSSGFSLDSVYNSGINFQGNLNKLWFETEGDWEVNGTFGEYCPEKFSPLMYYGIVTSAYWAPDRLPINGIDIKGKLYGNYKFELLQADDLTWIDYGPYPIYYGYNPYDLWASDFYQNNGYHNRMYGALGGYEKKDMDFDISYLRIYEDRASRPGCDLIPKDEILFGVRASYRLCEDKLKIFGEFNNSWFDYNLLDSSNPRETGNALIIGGEGTISNFYYKGQFIRLEGNYEPFNFRQIFEFKFTPSFEIGEEIYMPSLYRPNRIGFDGHVTYSFDEEKGNILGGITCFSQIDPTLDINPQTTIGSNYGFQDHSFFNNSTDKGKEFYYDIGGTYHITDKWYVEGHFFSFNFQRDYPEYIHDQTRRYVHIAGSYNITDELKLSGLYQLATIDGIDDYGYNTDITLNIPGVSMAYSFNENTTLGVDYRFYNYNDNLDVLNDYNANRISTWMQLSF